MENMKVAAVQMNSLVGAVAQNLQSLAGWVAKAAAEEVDLICFPEMSISGYAMPQSTASSESLVDEAVAQVLEMSAEYAVTIAAGISERAEGQHYLTHFIAEEGRLVGSYRKTHLGEREKVCYTAGDSIEVINCRKARIGIQLCWESHFPEISSILALKGADVILMPHASGLPAARTKEVWDKCLRARAYDNSVYVVACNQLDDNGLGTVFGGGCVIIDPRGNVLAEDYAGKASILTAELTSDQLDKLRQKECQSMKDLYYLNRRRPELYGVLTKREIVD